MNTGCQRFVGKIAIVTGGATGIGRATALRLASEGATVFAADVNTTLGAEADRLLQAQSPRSRFLRVDVTQPAEVKALIETAMAEAGRIDVLVNNAGIPGKIGPIDELDDDMWAHVITTNLSSVFLCTKYALPGLQAAPHGAVVSVASTFGMVGAPGTPAYAAAKGGIIALTKQLAVDLGPRGIRVNAVSPGYVDNDMDQRRTRMTPEAAAANLAAREAAAALQPLGRQGDVSEIAAAIAFLASDDASFMTGALVPVDAGCTATFNLGYR